MEEATLYAKRIWDYMLMHHELRPMDAVFVLGSSDTRVAEYAADLFLKGYGKYLILAGDSGAKWGKPVRLEKPEAEVFADIAKARGILEEKILIENKSSNTGENIEFTRAMLEERGLSLHSFLLVQKPYMERRTFATFKKRWPEAECIVTSPPIAYEEYAASPRYQDRWIDIMVGDLQRIKEYPAKGFQIPQEIPVEAEEAFERLIELGYTKSLIRD